MRTLHHRVTLLAVALVALIWTESCGSQQVSPQAPSQGATAAGAVVTAIAAGTLWAAGGGCRLQGCPYGSYCNQKSGYCDVRSCEQGCPEGTVCNEGLGRCQAPPPPHTPNDFLPQDNKANLPPGAK